MTAAPTSTWPEDCPACHAPWRLKSRTMGARLGQPHQGTCENGHHWYESELKFRPGDQQLPVVNDERPVQDQVVEYIERRKAVGVERYGTALQANNGRDALRDLFEELVDAVNYCAQTLIERDGHLP